MKIKLTAIYEKSPFGYIGYIRELPGANTQGKTLKETKENLIEAIKMVLEANKSQNWCWWWNNLSLREYPR